MSHNCNVSKINKIKRKNIFICVFVISLQRLLSLRFVNWEFELVHTYTHFWYVKVKLVCRLSLWRKIKSIFWNIAVFYNIDSSHIVQSFELLWFSLFKQILIIYLVLLVFGLCEIAFDFKSSYKQNWQTLRHQFT